MTDVTGLTRPAATQRGPLPKRAAILDAASRVFAREGFAGASIDVIAAEAGVSRQTIYNQIGDKEKVFAAVVEDTTERANAGLFATLATFPDRPKDLEAELTAFARRLAHDGLLDLDDPDLAARQLISLVNMDLRASTMMGQRPTEAEVDAATRAAVRTFLRAYGRKGST